MLGAIKFKAKMEETVDNEKDDEKEYNKKILKSVTLIQAVNDTLSYLTQLAEETDSLDINTVSGYFRNINLHIIPYFGENKKLCEITSDSVKKFLKHLFEKEKIKKDELLDVDTIKKVYSAFKWIIKYSSQIATPRLMRYNILANLRFKDQIPKGRSFKKKKVKNHPLNRLLELVATIDKQADIRLKTQINFVADVGCRREEILGVKWCNVNLDTGEVYYDEAVTAMIPRKFSEKHSGTRVKKLKSDYSYRTNLLTPYTINLLKQLKQFKQALGLSVDDNDYIFTRWDCDKVLSPITFSDQYKDFREKFGFEDIPAHDIRHMISNLLQEKGYPPEYVAQYLGNTPKTLLNSYTDILNHTKENIRITIDEATRSKNKKSFDIEIIANILNSDSDLIDKGKESYDLLDFLNGNHVSTDNLISSINVAKKIILKQYPQLEVFLSTNPAELNGKIKTFKTFNNPYFELAYNESIVPEMREKYTI